MRPFPTDKFARTAVARLAVALTAASLLLAALPATGQSPERPANVPATATPAEVPAETAPTPTAPANAATDPATVRVYLMEGSVISGRLSVPSLSVKTAFGTLEIPVENVLSFTPGLDSHPQLQKRIGRLIQQLGSNDAAERDQAQRELAELGPGVRSQLEPYRQDEDVERRSRVEKLLDEIDAASEDFSEEADPRLIGEDTVVTDRFTVVGRISPESFRVDTPFGPLTIALTDIRTVARETGRKPESRGRATVDASNLVQSGLKETPIRVERGDLVVVTATGQIMLTPWNVASSADGAGQNVPFYANGIGSGALVGRIGRNGEEFLVGTRKSFTAKSSGMLYLGVAMNHQFANQGYAFPGSYDVRVKINPAQP